MKTFRNLYEMSPEFSLKGKSLEEKYNALSIPHNLVMKTSDVEDKLICHIKSLLPTTDKTFITNHEINTLKAAFYYSKELFRNTADKKYYIAIHELRSILGNSITRYKPFSDSSAWTEALKYLKCYIELKGEPDDNSLSIGMENESCRISAIKRLRKLNISYKFDANNNLEVTKYQLCLRRISNMVEQIGGARFINKLLSLLDYDTSKGRFIILPPRDSCLSRSKPIIPIGYLLNLALRKTSSKGSDEALEKHWTKVINYAADICVALYPVGGNSMGWLDFLYSNPVEYMWKWIAYDSTLTMQQMSQGFCAKIMNFLIDKLNADGRCFAKSFTLEEYRSLMNEIYTLTKEKECVKLKRSQLISVTDEKHKNELIDEISNSCVNPCFEDPLKDYNHVNWSDKPIIRLGNRDLLLLPSSIGAYGWYELMMSLLREQDNKKQTEIEEKSKISSSKKEKYVEIDHYVGYALEDFIKTYLQSKGFHTKCGKYKVDGENGECDIVIESSNKIFLMEVKKKNLTRSARKGYKYQIILDIAGSLLYSQIQAFRTEVLLKRKGTIDLDDGETTSKLSYGGNECEKMTITLNEYGPLHDRLIQKGVLDALYRYTYEINEDEVKAIIADITKAKETTDNLKKIENKRKQLREYIAELSKYKRRGQYDPFFNSWFFSIEQLFYIIDKSEDVNDFFDKINKLKYITFSTKDFWAEVDLKLLITS